MMLEEGLVAAARSVTLVAMAWALWVSRRAWTGPRLAPRAPLLGGLPSFEPLFSFLFVLLAASLFSPLPVPALLILMALFSAADWTRFRPWLYQGAFMLLALTYLSPVHALPVCQLITISIYFWAGLMKVNRMFVLDILPYLTAPLCGKYFPRKIGYAVPFVEAAMGLGLLFPITRFPAILASLGMHAFILLCFSRWGHRTHREIWPWNASMALNNILLFAFSSHGAGVILWGSHPFHWFVLALFAILPVMGLLNLIDPVFSHGHMAGRHCTGGVILTRRLYLKLPPELRKQCMLRGRFYMIDIGRWWMHDLGVPQPQQERLLVEIARDFRRYQPARDDLRLFVARMPGMRCRTQPQHYYSWTDLFGHPL